MTDEEIYETILGMPSKSCELNTIPTKFLKKSTQTLSTINSKNSQPLTSHRRILQQMEIFSSATTYQSTRQRDSQGRLQTHQQLTIHLKNYRKVHPKSTNQTL